MTLVKPSTIQLVNTLVNNDPVALIKYEEELTITKSIEGTSLRKMVKETSKSTVIDVISYFANRLAENFNVGKKFTIEQCTIMAIDIVDVFCYETIEDVVLMFKYVRQGKIGDGKDFKLDSQTVFHKWIPQFLELKSIELEKQHNAFKGENNINNFKWDKEDIEKFKTSNNNKTITTLSTGLGQRSKKHFATEKTTISPIVNRSRYLLGLKYEVTKAPTPNLQNILEYFKEKEEQDAIEVIEKELEKRQNK